jgi:hypothetical protein
MATYSLQNADCRLQIELANQSAQSICNLNSAI